MTPEQVFDEAMDKLFVLEIDPEAKSYLRQAALALVEAELTFLAATISPIPDPDVGPSDDFVMAEQQLQARLAAIREERK